MKDARALGYCVRGIRQFCQETGIDFAGFVKDGFDLEEARKMDDARVNKLIQQAEGSNGR